MRTVRLVEDCKEYGRKVCREFTEKELLELPVEEKLGRMGIQRTVVQVAAECDIAFCEHCRFVEQLETINADDPLMAALTHARENDVTCFVQYGNYFGKVPSFKSDMRGWVEAFNLHDRMRLEGDVKNSKLKTKNSKLQPKAGNGG